ncbi:hypothetical protein [Lysobacter gummosus]|uniref:hypothetical protein n=1 Tax=Lysobacter gummosus TaxID=262324 RepID=UPI00362F266E
MSPMPGRVDRRLVVARPAKRWQLRAVFPRNHRVPRDDIDATASANANGRLAAAVRCDARLARDAGITRRRRRRRSLRARKRPGLP